MKIYQVKDPEGIILRDYLARDRTRLAAERTFLAYVRTALGFFSAGCGCVKLIGDSRPLYVLGIIFIAVSPFVLLWGVRGFIRNRRMIASIPDNDLICDE